MTAHRTTPARKNPLLRLPKEHGAYFQLAVPLVTALLMGSPTRLAAAFAGGAVVAFLLHEPLFVLLGRKARAARRMERTVLGEVTAGVILAALAVPVAYASGVSPVNAWGAFATWSAGCFAATWAVRSVIRSARGKAPFVSRVLPLALPIAGAALLAFVSLKSAIALVPVLAVTLALAVFPPHPRHLRRMGWALAASMTTASLLLILLP
jgi:hypothetical protein